MQENIKNIMALELYLEETNMEIEEINAEIAEKQKMIIALQKKKRNIELELLDAKRENGDISLCVTDHAIVRYLERVKGVDLSEIKNSVLGECEHAKLVGGINNFVLYRGDHKFVVRNGSVVTILDRKQENSGVPH